MRQTWVGLLALLAALGPNQDVRAGTNLGTGGYPSHQCGKKPVPPERPEYFKSEADLDAYNKAVEAYNTGTEQFFQCIQHYVNSAAEDIQLIKQTLTSTIDEANR